MAKQYTVDGRVFRTQSELEKEVKEHLNAYALNTVFKDDFLAAVINTYHPNVIAAGQTCTGVFEYLDWDEQTRRGMDTADRFRGGKVVYSYFEPLGDWRDVTVYPWRKSRPENEIKKALREKVSRVIPRPSTTDICNREGCEVHGDELEYQHIKPTFEEMASQCMALVTPEEIESKFGYSKFIPGRDHLVHCIPDDHPAVRLLISLHESNEWEWLCPFHHRGVQERASWMF